MKKKKSTKCNAIGIVFSVLTCDGGEVDPNQQGEKAGDVCQDITVTVGCGTVRIHIGEESTLLQEHAFLQIVTKQVLCNDKG